MTDQLCISTARARWPVCYQGCSENFSTLMEFACIANLTSIALNLTLCLVVSVSVPSTSPRHVFQFSWAQHVSATCHQLGLTALNFVHSFYCHSALPLAALCWDGPPAMGATDHRWSAMEFVWFPQLQKTPLLRPWQRPLDVRRSLFYQFLYMILQLCCSLAFVAVLPLLC